MLCAKPVQLALGEVPCGQCMNCRANRRRMWTGRILMEAHYAENPSWFVTLTYADEHIPLAYQPETGEWLSTLAPNDVRNFMMRWRQRYGAQRFFFVGEYGDRTQRAHYHAVLFDVKGDDLEAMVRTTWPEDEFGYSSVSEMNARRAQYVASYTVKKLNKRHDDLGNRYPEFARMSRKPPLGAKGVEHMLKVLESPQGAEWLAANQGRLPGTWRYQGKRYPVGKYWADYMHEVTGYEKAEIEATPEEWERWTEQAEWACIQAERRGTEKGSL